MTLLRNTQKTGHGLALSLWPRNAEKYMTNGRRCYISNNSSLTGGDLIKNTQKIDPERLKNIWPMGENVT